jgi:hypothetical protein
MALIEDAMHVLRMTEAAQTAVAVEAILAGETDDALGQQILVWPDSSVPSGSQGSLRCTSLIRF